MRRWRVTTSKCAAVCAGTLLLALPWTGCGPQAPLVLEMKGLQMTLDQLREEYEARRGAGSFAAAPAEERELFLRTIGDKEVLLRIAKEMTGELHPPFDRFAREASEKWLISAVQERVVGPTIRDSVAIERAIDAYDKQLRLSWFLHPIDSIAVLAHQRIAAGESFSKIAAQYSAVSTAKVDGGDLGWVTGENVGYEATAELFLEGHGKGFMTPVRHTPRGWEFHRIEDVREFDIRSKEGFEQRFPPMIRAVRAAQRLEAWTDSLREANGFRIQMETIPILRERMQVFWDSMTVQSGTEEGARRIAREYEAPLAFFSAQELEMSVYDFRGSTVSVREYLQGLREVPMILWAGGATDGRVAEQVNRRMIMAMQMDAAREMGLDRTPEYLTQARINREKHWIEQFHTEAIDEKAVPTEEDLQAFYDANRDSYVRGDKIRLSYAIFPQKAEADRFYEEARNQTGEWWASKFTEWIEKRPDLTIVANSEDYDLTQPVPEDVRPMIELGIDRNVTDVLRPAQISGRGWGVSRVLRRERPGVTTLDEVRVGVTRIVRKEKTDRMIEELLEDGRARFGLKYYPENLTENPS